MHEPDSSPRVSVVLPVFNAERFIAAAVDSILAQTLQDFELIAIDDGSTDGTPAILADRTARDGRVRIMHRGHRGVVAALNDGLREARADFVAIMNADDVALPQRLAQQLAFLDAHPAVAAVGTQSCLMLADGRLGTVTSLPQAPAALRVLMMRASPLSSPTVMLRRRAVLELGGFRPQFAPAAEDYDLWLRLGERHELANLPDVLLFYRLHPGQLTGQAYEAGAIAALVAQAAARARQAGHPDPVAGRSSIDRDFAATLGITESRIARFAIENALSRGECLMAVGAPAGDCVEPLESLRPHAIAAREPALLAGAGRWLRGRLLVRDGQWVPALLLFFRSATADAVFRRRLVGAVARRLGRNHPGRWSEAWRRGNSMEMLA
jgi:glycosyltransferase involved in cell wall biosynthesis